MNRSLIILFFTFMALLLFSPAWGETVLERCENAFANKDYASAYPACMSAAQQGGDSPQLNLGIMYYLGEGAEKDYSEAAFWFRKAAEQENAVAQLLLGQLFAEGMGVMQDSSEAAYWLRKSTETGNSESHKIVSPTNLTLLQALAERGVSAAQYELARRYVSGDGVDVDKKLAEKLLIQSLFNDPKNENTCNLIDKEFDWHCINNDDGNSHLLIHKNIMKSKNLSWFWSLSLKKILDKKDNEINSLILKSYDVMNCDNRTVGNKSIKRLYYDLTVDSKSDFTINDTEIEFKPLEPDARNNRFFHYVCGLSKIDSTDKVQEINFGTGWPIQPGYVVTNQHVVNGKNKIHVMLASGQKLKAKVLIEDKINDLAILEISQPGKLPPALPVAKSSAKSGSKVFTIGFPHPDMMGAKPKLTEGIVNAVTGYMDDPRTLQISVPVQSGNSGGPLLNMNGEVVGIVTAKLSAVTMFNWTGDLPQNVNYAVKAPYLTALVSSLNDQPTEIKVLPIKQASLETLSSRIQNSILMIIAEQSSTDRSKNN